MNNPSIRGYIPFKIQIDGTESYKNFFKKHYKFIHVGDFKFFQSSFGKQTRTKLIVKKLAKIAKKAKKIQGLLLHRSVLYDLKQTKSQFQSIIKCFSNIRFLSLHVNGASENLIETYTKWLHNSKRLVKFYFMLRKYTSAPFSDKLSTGLKSFIKVLKRKRLDTLKIWIRANSNDNLKQFLDFRNYFKTIKKLNISWKTYENQLFIPSLPPNEASISHLKSLKTLNLMVPISTSLMKYIMSTIESPLKIKIFGAESLSDGVDVKSDSVYLNHALDMTKYLQKIHLKLNTWIEIPKNFNKMRITNLKLETLVEEPNNLIFLSQVLGNLENLQSLSFTARSKNLLVLKPDTFNDFFNGISQLNHLHKLKLYFLGITQEKDQTQSSTFLVLLNNCIKNMIGLKEISIRFHQATPVDGWNILFKTLSTTALNLKKLRLYFSAQKLEHKELQGLTDLLKQLRSIEVLALNNFWFEGLQDFEAVMSCFNLLMSLRILKLYQLNGNIHRTHLALFMKKLLARKGFQKLDCTANSVNEECLKHEIKDADRVNLKEIVKNKNKDLELAYTPFDLYVGSSDVRFCKWT